MTAIPVSDFGKKPDIIKGVMTLTGAIQHVDANNPTEGTIQLWMSNSKFFEISIKASRIPFYVDRLFRLTGDLIEVRCDYEMEIYHGLYTHDLTLHERVEENELAEAA